MTKIIPRMTSEAQRTGLSHLDRRVLVAHLQPMPLLFLDMYPTYWEVSNTTCTCTKNIGAFISWIPLLPPIYEDTDFTQLRIHFLALSPYILPPLSVRTDVSLLTKAVSIKKCAHPRFSIPIMLDFYLWYRHRYKCGKNVVLWFMSNFEKCRQPTVLLGNDHVIPISGCTRGTLSNW